jgi:hypothetical protein
MLAMGMGDIGKGGAAVAKKSVSSSVSNGIGCILLLHLVDPESSPHSNGCPAKETSSHDGLYGPQYGFISRCLEALSLECHQAAAQEEEEGRQ